MRGIDPTPDPSPGPATAEGSASSPRGARRASSATSSSGTPRLYRRGPPRRVDLVDETRRPRYASRGIPATCRPRPRATLDAPRIAVMVSVSSSTEGPPGCQARSAASRGVRTEVRSAHSAIKSARPCSACSRVVIANGRPALGVQKFRARSVVPVRRRAGSKLHRLSFARAHPDSRLREGVQ